MSKENLNEDKKYKMTKEECGCTIDDFINSLKFLPKPVLMQMVSEGKIEATCDNCGTEYKIEGEELERVKEIAENSTNISGCDISCCDGCTGCD